MKKKLLFAFFIFSRLLSFAQWSDDAGVNTPVIVTAGNQYVYNTISDGAGGIISVWGDDVASNGTTVFKNALYAQKLSALGVKQWGANGVKISDSENNGVYAFSVSDGSGGSIITWVENVGDVD